MIWHGGVKPDLAQLTALGEGTMPGFLGIEFTDVGDDWIEARMPVEARVHQPYGRLHGGASVVLAETIGSVGAAMSVDRATHGAVGLEINANHVRPVRDGFVTARASCESRGRTTQIWTIRITDDAGKLVCIARITMAIIAMDRA